MRPGLDERLAEQEVTEAKAGRVDPSPVSICS